MSNSSSSGRSIAPIIAISAFVLLVIALFVMAVFFMGDMTAQRNARLVAERITTPTETTSPVAVINGFPAQHLHDVAFHNGQLYYTYLIPFIGATVYSVTLDDTTPQEFTISKPENWGILVAFDLTDEGNFRFLTNTAHLDANDDLYLIFTYEVFDRAGNRLVSQELLDLGSRDVNFLILDTLFLHDGGLIFSALTYGSRVLYVLDSNFSVRNRVELESFHSFAQTKDGRAFLFMRDENWNPLLKEIDSESGAFMDPVPFGFDLNHPTPRLLSTHRDSPFDLYFSIYHREDFIYDVYGYTFATESATLLFHLEMQNFSALGIGDHVTFWPDGRISILHNAPRNPEARNPRWQTYLIVLTP